MPKKNERNTEIHKIILLRLGSQTYVSVGFTFKYSQHLSFSVIKEGKKHQLVNLLLDYFG